ncbi:MAG: alpha/beta fold hydrolase [Methyloprofundus sp.]|nr:alpha/beta fold hydrolase [Methyloprofundus sp.]
MSKAIPLHFEEYGQSSLPALLIIHGFFASSRNWRQIAKKLAGHYHVYVLDMRNHGESPHTEEMSYPEMAADIELFLDTHNLEAAHFIGHSMGGKALMWFALHHPERINRQVIVDISPVSYRHSFDNLISALQELPLEQLTNRKQADDLLSGPIPEASFRQFLLQNLVLKEGKYTWRIDLAIFAKTADNIITFPEVEELWSYTHDVLFLGGEMSDYIKEEAVYALFPNAQIKTIAGAGHWVHAQQPDAFCQAVVDFLG